MTTIRGKNTDVIYYELLFYRTEGLINITVMRDGIEKLKIKIVSVSNLKPLKIQ